MSEADHGTTASTEQSDQPKNISDLDEGDYVHDHGTGEVYEVFGVQTELAEDGFVEGDVTFRDIGRVDGEFTRDAKEVNGEIQRKNIRRVSGEVLENPEEMLIQFAKAEIHDSLRRYGHIMEEDRVDGADVLGDVQAAAFVHSTEDE